MVVGTRLNYVMGFGRPPRFAEAARWIRIDIYPEELPGRPADVGIGRDARYVLRQPGQTIDGQIGPQRYDGWLTRPRVINSKQQVAPEELTDHAQVPTPSLRLRKAGRA